MLNFEYAVDDKLSGVNMCGNSRCGTCAYLKTESSMIYCKVCGHCQEYYIGHTDNSFF